MKIFELVGKGVGTYGLNGAALTVNDLLQIEDDSAVVDQNVFQHFRNIVSLTYISTPLTAFTENNTYMFLRDWLSESFADEGSTWQSNICYGEEGLDFYDQSIRAELNRLDKEGLFKLRDTDSSALFSNNDTYVTIDGIRYDPKAGNRIFYFGFLHNCRYMYQLRAVSEFVDIIPDDDSVKLYLNDLSDSEMATIRANDGVSVSSVGNFPINKFLRSVQAAEGNSYLDDVLVYIKVEHVKTGVDSGLEYTYKVTLEINGADGDVYLMSKNVDMRMDPVYSVAKFFEVFISSDLFWKRVMAAEINEIGPEVMSYDV